MQISFYSLLMAVAWSGLFVIIVYALRRSKAGFVYYNTASLLVILLGSLFRFAFPLDFPGFTQPISSTSILADIDTRILSPVKFLADSGMEVSYLGLFCIIWATVALLILLTEGICYYYMVQKSNRFFFVDSGLAYDIADSFCEESHIRCFRVCKDKTVDVPYVYGYLYPRVILPDIEFTPEELKCIIIHELMHWKNRDLWIRLLTLLICSFFWWDPFMYLLLWNMDQMLELKCDLAVVDYLGLDDDGRERYMNILLDAAMRCNKREKLSFLFLLRSRFVNVPVVNNLKERLNMIGDHIRNRKKERRVITMTAAVMAVLLIFSYRYILQPYFYEPEDVYSGRGGVEVSTNNGYLVQEEDGRYSMYIDNQFFEVYEPEIAQVLIDSGFEVRTK